MRSNLPSRAREDTSYLIYKVRICVRLHMQKYDIYCQGRKIYSSVTEDEMLDITQDLADQFYQNGTPHPDDIVVEYLGYDIE